MLDDPTEPHSQVKKRVIMVTGAGRGIGRACAETLLDDCTAMVINYLTSQEQAEELSEMARQRGVNTLLVKADVGNEQAVRWMMAKVENTYGQLDVLVCNAGVIRVGLAASTSWEDWNYVLQTNLTGAFFCCREAARLMLLRRSGTIVAISSLAGQFGGRGQVNYAASKGGLNAMIRALAVELGPRNIRVNGVAPGVIETDMSRVVRELVEDKILERTPLGRYGSPEEVASAVRFLASSDASYITGEIIAVSGGLGLS